MLARFLASLCLLAAVAAGGVAPAPAEAHARYKQSEPAADAVLATAPSQVKVWFTEAVRVPGSTLSVADASGNRVDIGAIFRDAADPKVLAVGLNGLPAGVYTVNWRSVSADDGDDATGSFAFTVGRPTVAGQVQMNAFPLQAAQHPQLGSVLVDARGMTLYRFTRDENEQSACYDQCAQRWPALVSTGTPATLGSGVGGTLGTTARRDGAQQVTYNGAPLYYFAGDANPGDATGQNVGGVWFVVAPDPAATAPSPASGGHPPMAGAPAGFALHIVRPVDGSTVPGPNVPVSVHIEGGELGAAPQQGHLHVSLDGQELMGSREPSFTIPNLPPGRHTLQFEYADNAHTFHVTQTVTIMVGGAATGPAAVSAQPIGMPTMGAAPKTTTTGQVPAGFELHIHQPTNGALVGPNVTIEVHPHGGQLGTAPAQGHLHVSLDGQEVMGARQETMTLPNVPPGQHTLAIEYADNAHTFSVTQTLVITVAPAGAMPAGGMPMGGMAMGGSGQAPGAAVSHNHPVSVPGAASAGMPMPGQPTAGQPMGGPAMAGAPPVAAGQKVGQPAPPRQMPAAAGPRPTTMPRTGELPLPWWPLLAAGAVFVAAGGALRRRHTG